MIASSGIPSPANPKTNNIHTSFPVLYPIFGKITNYGVGSEGKGSVQTPYSVTQSVMYSASVTSKEGFQTGISYGAIAFPYTLRTSVGSLSSIIFISRWCFSVQCCCWHSDIKGHCDAYTIQPFHRFQILFAVSPLSATRSQPATALWIFPLFNKAPAIPSVMRVQGFLPFGTQSS